MASDGSHDILRIPRLGQGRSKGWTTTEFEIELVLTDRSSVLGNANDEASALNLLAEPVHRATYALERTAVTSIMPGLPEGRAEALLIATAALVPTAAANQTGAPASQGRLDPIR
jgi:hypothetical protein